MAPNYTESAEARPFNPAEYWQDRGKSYLHEAHLKGMQYRNQEHFFTEVVCGVKPLSVVELGCGFGRMTRSMAEAMPGTRFLGLDVSEDQIRHAEIFCCLQPNVDFLQMAIGPNSDIPRCDCVVASELFLHMPDEEMEGVIACALKAAPVLIHDFDRKPSDSPARHVFNHRIPAMYQRLGLPYEIFYRDEWALIKVRRAEETVLGLR